jgi:predicted dehydrogenase
MERKLRMGMVGGGRGAFIGTVHRMAAALDNRIELVCGALSSDPAKAKESGRDWFIPDDRNYGSWAEMFEKERRLPADRRMDFVAVVTPNNMHFPVCKAAIEAGFHVVCDKPMTVTLAEAKELEALVAKSGIVFCLTHNYTGYPMVKEARALVRGGALGAVRKVVVEYPQGWLSSLVEAQGHKQAAWRTDPSKAGASSCIGDIGTHAENLTEYITGLKITELCADFTTFLPGRRLEDDANLLLHLEGGARGVLFTSQVSAGEENPLKIRVYGEKGGLHWLQEEPNTLLVKWLDRPWETRRTGIGYPFLSAAALGAARIPAGHPEGFLEAFANLYRNFAETLSCRLEGRQPRPEFLDFPTVKDGVRGVALIETAVESAQSDRKWVPMRS